MAFFIALIFLVLTGTAGAQVLGPGVGGGGTFNEAGDFALTGEWDFSGGTVILPADSVNADTLDVADDYTWTGQHVFSDTIGTLESAGAFGAGTCTDSGFHGVDTTNEVPYFCSDGAGGNPRSFSSIGDGYTQVAGNSGSATASGSSTLNVVGTNNITCAAADGSPDSVTCQLSISSQAQGDIIYHNGTTWVRLGAGTSGHYLQTQGAAANPQWAAAASAPSQLHVFTPQQNEPPAASFATLDTRNSHPILLFADAVDSSAVFSGIFNRGYSGGALSVDIHFSMGGGVVTNAVGWCAQIEALVAQDIDSDGFHAVGAGLCVSATVSGTDGGLAIGTVALSTSEIDSIAAGGAFRLKIMRDGDGTNITDSATGTAQLRMVEIRQ